MSSVPGAFAENLRRYAPATRRLREAAQRYVDAAWTDGSLLNRVQWHNCRLELTLARGDEVAALASANRLLELSTAAN